MTDKNDDKIQELEVAVALLKQELKHRIEMSDKASANVGKLFLLVAGLALKQLWDYFANLGAPGS